MLYHSSDPAGKAAPERRSVSGRHAPERTNCRAAAAEEHTAEGRV